MSDARPIGVFDSGIGGLTVVKALRDLLPNENIVYLGDTARVPYGPTTPETVQRYALELAQILTQKNAKALVVACNTVSSVALPLLANNFSVPVIGVIVPGARGAVEEMLNEQSLRAAPQNRGELHVALTDAADNFLNVARNALQLSFGEIELQALP